jgi:hypothetical protein
MGRRGKKELTDKQREKFAEWCERVGLIIIGSLVIQLIVDAESIIDLPLIAFGVMSGTVMYYSAYRLMLNVKSS